MEDLHACDRNPQNCFPSSCCATISGYTIQVAQVINVLTVVVRACLTWINECALEVGTTVVMNRHAYTTQVNTITYFSHPYTPPGDVLKFS